MDLYEELLQLEQLDLVYLLPNNGAEEIGVNLTELGEDVQAGTAKSVIEPSRKEPQPSPGRDPAVTGFALPVSDPTGEDGDRSRLPGCGRCRRRRRGWGRS
jgi:hypothetical protein